MKIQQFFSKILTQMNLTVLKGDLRKEVLEMGAKELPSELIQNAKLLKNREEALNYIPKGGVIVEVGVAYGEFSSKMLAIIHPTKFIAIDAFGKLPITTNNGLRGLDEEQISEHYKFYKDKFKSQINMGLLETKRGYSWDKIAELEDGTVDYFYIDADHSYESVKKDINALKNKLKSDGIIQFNDYTCLDIYSLEPYGVYRAVNDFLIEENFEILYLCFEKFGFYDIVVKRKINSI